MFGVCDICGFRIDNCQCSRLEKIKSPLPFPVSTKDGRCNYCGARVGDPCLQLCPGKPPAKNDPAEIKKMVEFTNVDERIAKTPASKAETLDSMLPASERQIGGSHYMHYEIQPAEFVYRNKIPKLEGDAIYYILRWRDKGKLQDLDKAIHTLQMIIELEIGERE